MARTLGIVEVYGGAGQRSSFAGRRFGDTSLLQWVVRRVTDCQQLDRIVVVVPAGDELESVARRCAPADVDVVAGEAGDPLGCFAAALRQDGATAAVRISVHRPFVDPALVDRLVASAHAAASCDYASFCLSDGRPAVLAPVGLVAEWCGRDAVLRADRLATDARDRWDATRYLYRHPDQFLLRLIPLPAPLDREDLRLEICGEDDWELAQIIYDALGPESLEWQRIAQLLEHHPTMLEKMAVLNRTTSRD